MSIEKCLAVYGLAHRAPYLKDVHIAAGTKRVITAAEPGDGIEVHRLAVPDAATFKRWIGIPHLAREVQANLLPAVQVGRPVKTPRLPTLGLGRAHASLEPKLAAYLFSPKTAASSRPADMRELDELVRRLGAEIHVAVCKNVYIEAGGTLVVGSDFPVFSTGCIYMKDPSVLELTLNLQKLDVLGIKRI